MMKNIKTGILVIMAMLVAACTHSSIKTRVDSIVEQEGRVHMTWQSMDKFSDVIPSNESKWVFYDRIVSQLGYEIERLGEGLNPDLTLKVTITDLDLAGQVVPNRAINGSGPWALREIDRTLYPRITLSYELVDKQKVVLKAAEDIEIRDAVFLETLRMRPNHRPFTYEKRLLAKWYKEEFIPQYSSEVKDK